jgi:short-subunit dehydrogenase
MTIPANSILITGASSGLGAVLAAIYAAAGVTLWLTGRSHARLESIATDCRAKGATVETAVLDVTARDEMARWITACDAARPLDLIIANAGISAGTGGIAKDGSVEAPGQAQRIFAINVDGVFNTVEPAIPLMRRHAPRAGVIPSAARGQIAIMSSLAGFRGFPGAPSYSASKAAVKAWGEALRPILMRDGISVSVICPGFVTTPMTATNDYRMPFLMPAKKAAQIMRRGLDRGQARIAYPGPMHFAAWLVSALPATFGDRILRNSPGKSPLDD